MQECVAGADDPGPSQSLPAGMDDGDGPGSHS